MKLEKRYWFVLGGIFLGTPHLTIFGAPKYAKYANFGIEKIPTFRLLLFFGHPYGHASELVQAKWWLIVRIIVLGDNKFVFSPDELVEVILREAMLPHFPQQCKQNLSQKRNISTAQAISEQCEQYLSQKRNISTALKQYLNSASNIFHRSTISQQFKQHLPRQIAHNSPSPVSHKKAWAMMTKLIMTIVDQMF